MLVLTIGTQRSGIAGVYVFIPLIQNVMADRLGWVNSANGLASTAGGYRLLRFHASGDSTQQHAFFSDSASNRPFLWSLKLIVKS